MTSDSSSSSPVVPGSSESPYVVVARRYRPRTFGQLVGQQHVTRALINAIESGRVGHAYLFTGARGVGKTSTARILAKALNAPGGPTIEPDDEADICQAIDAGEDVDVIEIDGASNRGIDEIRQLRANANVRPSRARYKIYIIDEVHMLTPPAFNALLKTLEEPPAHVKFIFCTTDPQKIPITVLSRCQRFDFAPVEMREIVERLQLIVDAEGRQAEGEALQLLARRAEGSMRDSQSLLEQLLAYGDGVVSAQDVHQMLGTAQAGRLAELTACLVRRDAAAALSALDTAVADGVDCGQLAEQLLEYFRDMLVLVVGGDIQLLRNAADDQLGPLRTGAKALGLETILAMSQMVDQTLMRMRQSMQPRVMMEICLVRMCNLDNLDQLAQLIDQLGSGPATGAAGPRPAQPPRRQAGSPPDAGRRAPSSIADDYRQQDARGAQRGTSGQAVNAQADTAGPAANPPARASKPVSATPALSAMPGQPTAAPAAAESRCWTADEADTFWKRALQQLEDMTADMAAFYERVSMPAADRLAVHFPARYTLQKESCEQPERKRKLEDALARAAGKPVRIDFELIPGPSKAPVAPRPARSQLQLLREKEGHPWVRQAMELFDAEVTRVDPPRPDATAGGPQTER